MMPPSPLFAPGHHCLVHSQAHCRKSAAVYVNVEGGVEGFGQGHWGHRHWRAVLTFGELGSARPIIRLLHTLHTDKPKQND